MTKSGWAITALIIAVLALGFFQIKSCRDNTADNLAHDRDSLKIVNATLKMKTWTLQSDDSVMRIIYQQKTDAYHLQIDSLSKLSLFYRQKAGQLSQALASTLAKLSASASGGDDSATIAELEDLKRQFSDYKNQNDFGNQISDQSKSIYESQISFDSSVIAQKNRTIDSLISVIKGKDEIIDKLMANIDTAIRQLKAHKRVSFLTTLALIVVGAFAIFKN